METFKKLRGRAILVDIPQRQESGIKLSEKDEDAMMAEAMKAWNKLNVYAVGSTVEDVQAGDQVYIRTSALNLEHLERIEIDGKVRFVLNEADVVIVW